MVRMTEWFLDEYRILSWILLLYISHVKPANVNSTTQVNSVNVNPITGCPDGRMGPECSFSCRCRRGCLRTGDCVANDTCLKHYFGDACQYQDLTKDVNQSETMLTDSNDTTCKVVDRVSIFVLPTFLTFLRAVAKDKESLDKINFEFHNNGKNSSIYIYQRQVGSTTKEYYCSFSPTINEILIIGRGGPILCTVNVSGGRSIILSQDTETSTYLAPNLKRAGVDGFYPPGETTMKTGSCYTASVSEETSFYLVKFPNPMTVYFFYIINRPEPDLRANLNGYTLHSYNERNVSIIRYKDQSDTGKLVHRIINNRHYEPVSMFKVEKSKADSPHPLGFCELQAFGDCPTGYVGLDCRERCSPHCGRDCSLLGLCIGCKAYHYGTLCELECKNCGSDGYCHALDGTCKSGCKPGYFTPQCNKACSPNCYGVKCLVETGVCEGGCKDGFYSDTCQHTCPTNCAGNACDSSGLCNTGCVAGYFGSMCKQSCSPGCKNNTCDPKRGNCASCNPGYTGDHCELKCHNCAGDGSCDKATRECAKGCQKGFRGSTCEEECSERCNGCSKKKGYCTYGCKAGWYGDQCEKACPTNCAGNACDSSGLCDTGCVAGYFGSMCKQSCSPGCKNNTCDTKRGNCASCNPGHTGDHCELKCHKCAGDGSCDKATRECAKGCQKGFRGSTCQEEADSIDVLPKLLLVAFFFFAVLVLLISTFCRLKDVEADKWMIEGDYLR